MSNLETLSQAVLPALSEKMKVDISVTNSGKCLVAYNSPFSEKEKPEWVEYRPDISSLTFYTSEGVGMNLGRTLKQDMCKDLSTATEAKLICLAEGKVKQNFVVPFIASSKGVN
jgi:hypothetical protein